MGRQYRPPRQGGSFNYDVGHVFNGPSIATSSSTAIVIPNYGVTDISTWPAGEYVLDVPSSGVEKTLISASSTSLARVIRMSTAATVKVNGNGGAQTQITFNATAGMCVTLIGQNSTSWIIKSMHPPTAVNSTGIVSATS